jgi:hypothetical protein
LGIIGIPQVAFTEERQADEKHLAFERIFEISDTASTNGAELAVAKAESTSNYFVRAPLKLTLIVRGHSKYRDLSRPARE